MKKIHRADSNAEADLIKSFLESHEIPVYIQGYSHRSLLGLVGSYIPLDLMVPEDLAAEARQLIHEHETELMAAPELPAKDAPVGLKPTAKTLRPRSRRVGFMMAFLLPGLGNLYAGSKALGQWLLVITGCTIVGFMLFIQQMPQLAYILVAVLVSLIAIDATTTLKALHDQDIRQR